MRIFLAALAAALVLSACGDDAAGPPQAPLPAVDVVTLRAQPVTLTREVAGRATASQIAQVRPQVSGIVKARLFEEGSFVEAGQPLYQLDDATYRADLASAQAALARAEATLEAARLRAKRAAELVKIDAISTQENENAIAALREAEADVASARAAVQRNSLNVQYARITSPIDGRIGTSSVTQGALVTANQPEPLATVQQLDPMHVDINATVDDLMEFRRAARERGLQSDPEGFPVSILLPDGSRYEHRGRVQSADLSVDPTTGSFSMRVIVPNPDHILLPGMYVRAVAELGVLPDGLLAPQRAITRDPKGNATAMVVQADDTVAVRQVRTGRAIGDDWVVEAGLEPGDRVIVSGIQRVQPGMQVAPSEATPLPPGAADSPVPPGTRAVPPHEQPASGAAESGAAEPGSPDAGAADAASPEAPPAGAPDYDAPSGRAAPSDAPADASDATPAPR